MKDYVFMILLPNIDWFFRFLGGIGVASWLLGLFLLPVNKSLTGCKDEKNKIAELSDKLFKVFVVSVIGLFITCFIPGKRDILQMKAISLISEQKGADKLPQKIVDKLNTILDTGHPHVD